MARVKTSKDNGPVFRPGLSPESMEKQVCAMAVNLAARQIMDGTASSQIITHYLKLCTKERELEKEKLQRETELLKAKADALQAAKHGEELFERAIQAMKKYSGSDE